MTFTNEELQEMKEIHFKQPGTILTDEEQLDFATRLVTLIENTIEDS